MKTYLFLGALSSVLFFSSCSGNDDNDTPNNPEAKIFLSKVTTVNYTNPSNINTSVVTFDYNSKKQLIKVSSQGRSTSFEYDTTGKLSKTNYYNTDGTSAYYTTCTYNENQLTTIKSIYPDSNGNTTKLYTYNNDKITGTSLCSSLNCTIPSTSSYTYSGDNVSTEISFSDNIGGPFTFKREFSYDNKINPYSLTNTYFRTYLAGTQFLSQNNYTSEKISRKDSEGNWIEIQNITYEIQYNSSQLPSKVIGKEANGKTLIEYNYEYITLQKQYTAYPG
ncbi:hypothetical protein H5J24_04795 [Chryseobacterium capnotolerans]|uniref:hypothetical protein n=1 Tax=Chryseobacterium TaxID=59732 RepID=UPI00083B1ED8|nr:MULTISPECIES: hypothetical protein [Chryseobacterium]UHO39427.1 hypothetical protein H5J24_04795 [Chryseobacterium capnotolerans]